MASHDKISVGCLYSDGTTWINSSKCCKWTPVLQLSL